MSLEVIGGEELIDLMGRCQSDDYWPGRVGLPLSDASALSTK